MCHPPYQLFFSSPPGTLFLWLFWPSFNGALASGNGQYRAIINTYYSLTGSVIASVLVSMMVDKERKISMVRRDGDKIVFKEVKWATFGGGFNLMDNSCSGTSDKDILNT